MFITRKCHSCNGTGESFDATNLDAVDADPAAGDCHRCKGAGVTEHLPAPAAAPIVSEPVGDVPDWMVA